MRITKLQIKDFRSIRELDISFEPDVTVVVGRNGAGKTSALDALAVIMWVVRSHTSWETFERLEFSRQDVRIGAEALEVKLEVEFGKAGKRSRRRESVSLTASGSDEDPIISGDSRLRKLWSREKIAPRIIYYRQHRGFEQMKHEDDDPDKVFDPEVVQDIALLKNLRAISHLELWWDHRDAQEARTVRDTANSSYRDPQLEAVRSLITKIDGFSGISFEGASIPRGLHLVKNDETAVHVSRLSSGERSYVILLADLARRLQVFAPYMPLEEIPAIVLIDEVELNLHPGWQSEILDTLSSVFQKCQFIVTTHSPQVLSGVRNRHVRILDVDSSGRTKATPPLYTRGRSSNYLLEGVLGAARQYPPVRNLINEFNRAIDRGDHTTAQEMLVRIEDETDTAAPTPDTQVMIKRLESLKQKS